MAGSLLPPVCLLLWKGAVPPSVSSLPQSSAAVILTCAARRRGAAAVPSRLCAELHGVRPRSQGHVAEG